MLVAGIDSKENRASPAYPDFYCLLNTPFLAIGDFPILR